MKKQKNIRWPVIMAVVLLFGGWLIIPRLFNGARGTPTASAETLTVYKSPLCGCCTNYVAYLRRQGYEVTVVETNEMADIKNQYGIPKNMESCHTTVRNNNDTVIEGHIPVEVMQKFMQEETGMRGIMMPGMPAGSPGMPGVKNGVFEIYGLEADGQVLSYMDY